MVRWGAGCILIVFAAGAFPDVITIGDRTYEGVVVERDQSHYYVHLPDEGRVLKISRKRQDVSTPTIESNSAVRESLLMRFESNKPALPLEPENAHPDSLSNAEVEQHHRVRDLALFEAQLEHWQRLSEQQRSAVDRMLLGNALGEVGDYMNSVEAMGGDTSSLRARLEAIARGEVNGSTGGGSTQRTAPRATPRSGSTGRQKSLVRRTEGDAKALRLRTLDDTARIFDLKRRIDALSNAVANGYVAQLSSIMVETWEGKSSRKTLPFSIDAAFWRVNCVRDDFGRSGSFSVTVIDAETDLPITRLGDVDFLQMRVCVLDGPGQYYLKIEQDESGIPYEIRAVTFAE